MKVKTRDMQEFEKNKLENEEICLEEGIQSRKTPKKAKRAKTKGLFEDDMTDLDLCKKNDKIWIKKANPSIF